MFDTGLNWLALRDGKQAATVFERCLKEFPSNPRKAEFLLYLGQAYSFDDKQGKARKTLNSLIAEFPLSEAAGKARQLLGSF